MSLPLPLVLQQMRPRDDAIISSTAVLERLATFTII
jgi:hypothetical protein